MLVFILDAVYLELTRGAGEKRDEVFLFMDTLQSVLLKDFWHILCIVCTITYKHRSLLI